MKRGSVNKTTIVRARTCAVSAGLIALLLPSAAQAKFGDDTLQVGDRGRDVKIAQKYLTKAGIRTTVDGVYGKGTASKVKRFERAEDLRVNGKLEPADARALKAAAKRGPSGDDDSGDAGGNGGAEMGSTPSSNPGDEATISADGKTAVAPANAPDEVKQAIAAANKITDKPYKYGGGHGDFEDSGYDCSGAVSYALHGAGLLDKPLDSTGFMSWGESGEGEWITVYGKSSHAFIVIAGARFDTSGAGEEGPRWRKEDATTSGYAVRHPEGL
jgi:peptidoglycan hydrolase-like protein with peptidoglycan-binding domain